MNSKLWIRKATSMCLMVAILATYSMVALATESKASGELIINGNESVTVNGEAAKSGRTIFTSSMISTQGSSATIDLGKTGMIEVAPNTAITVAFNTKALNVELASGTVTALKSANTVNVNVGGKLYVLNAGESVTTTPAQDKDDDDEKKGGAWWLWAIVFGGAAAGILIATAQSGNDIQLGGNGTVVSPTR